ncbi:MAG: hypothetical protein WEC59_04020, partial [Salibacteraceae bacterium]
HDEVTFAFKITISDMALRQIIKSLQTNICLFTMTVALAACKPENKLAISEPDQGVEITIDRLDQQWFEMSAVDFRKKHNKWQATYGSLYQHYVEDVLSLGSVNDSNLFTSIRRFTTDPAIAEVQDSVQRVFPELSDLEEAFSTAWNYYQYYFPDKKAPLHLSFIGGFNTPAALSKEGIGIGLEMFLGKNTAFYEYLQLPVYLRQNMTPTHLVPTVLRGWIQSEFPQKEITPTLIQTIISEGKVLYAMDAIFPFHHDSLKINYTGDEIKWADQHQKYVWAHFIDNELLFSTDPKTIQKFTSDGPFTVDLVKESPSRMGHYIGWQIVRHFMDRQDTIDMPALMKTDTETILNKSKYKP